MSRSIHVLLCVALCLSSMNAFKTNLFSKKQFQTKSIKFIATLTSSLAILTSANINVNAAELSLKEYSNDRYHTKISYPSNWEYKEGSLSSERTVVAFVDPSDIDTSVSVAFNPIPADFSRLTSFGTRETLKSNLLPRGEGVTTETIKEAVKGENYFLEYTVSAPDAPTRHVLSIFALRPAELVVGGMFLLFAYIYIKYHIQYTSYMYNILNYYTLFCTLHL